MIMTMADIAEQLEHSINGGGLKFDYFSPDEKHRLSVFSSAQHTDRDSYYGGGKDLNAYGKTTDLTFMAGAQYVYRFDQLLFMPSDLTSGVEYNRDGLEDNMWGYNRYTKQIINIASVFLQNEWKTAKWGILIGARIDKHNLMDDAVVSPRANLRFNPTENLNFRLSYASGFRAPQAFDEDLHIDNVGGTVSMIELASDLKEEKSQSFSASADWYHRFGAFQTNFLVEGFYTKLADVFVLEDTGTYTGSMLVQHMAGYVEKDVAVTTRDFFDLGIKLAYDFDVYKTTKLQLNAGVQNLFNAYQNDFDKGRKRDSGYIYGPSMPRSYFAGIKISY